MLRLDSLRYRWSDMIYKKITTTAIVMCLTIGSSHADWIQSLTRGATKKATEQAIEQALTKQQNTQSDTNTRAFDPYTCTDDCSGHLSGYRWAQKNNVRHIKGCNGNNRSFNEGCTLFVNETSASKKNRTESKTAAQAKIRMENAVSRVIKTHAEHGALGVINIVKNCYNTNTDNIECVYMDFAGKYNEDYANQALGFPYNEYYRDNIFFTRIEINLANQGLNDEQSDSYIQALAGAVAQTFQKHP